jgi:hypothetical protein
MKNENANSINLTKKIIDIINFASHQFDIGNASQGNFQLNVAKTLIKDNLNKEVFVSREYIDNIVDEVSNWK